MGRSAVSLSPNLLLPAEEAILPHWRGAAGDNVMRVLPPLVIEESHIREFVEALSAAAGDMRCRRRWRNCEVLMSALGRKRMLQSLAGNDIAKSATEHR
jgi:hypothetical protein